MEYEYKDAIGREFISLGSLSTLLDLSKRQIIRHIRNKNLLSLKRDKKRYVLKDDILKEYPAIADRLVTMGQSDDSPLDSNVQENKITSDTSDIHVFHPNEQYENLTKKIDQISIIATQFQKFISNIRYIENDTKTTNKCITNLQTRMSDVASDLSTIKANHNQKGRGVWFNVISIISFIAILSAVGFGGYYLFQFKSIYQANHAQYEAETVAQEERMSSLSNQYEALAMKHIEVVKNYEQTVRDMKQEVENLKAVVSPEESQDRFNF